MNAKKIMGAVLVALLAAALFVGAAAADDKGTFFVYQTGASTLGSGVWTNGAATVTVDTSKNVIPGENFVPGTYKYNGNSAYFTYPTASYSATGKLVDVSYLIANGGKVYNTSGVAVDVNALNSDDSTIGYYLVTYPNGTVLNLSANPFVIGTPINVEGTYKIQAIFDASKFITGTPFDLLLDAASFSFTVVDLDDVTISASADQAYDGEAITITVEGTPGKEYAVNATGFTVATNQLFPIDDSPAIPASFNITIQNNGKAVFVATVNSSEFAADAEDKTKATIELVGVKDGKVSVKIASAVVTATLEKDSYYVGDVLKIEGTSTSNAELSFYIKGTNYNRTAALDVTGYVAGKTWKGEIATYDLLDKDQKKLDVGTYTITIKQGGKVVATLPVVLKQPFISLTSAPEVVVQGTAAKFVGTAEATDKVYYYVFGTNYFTGALVDGEDFDENKFTFEISKETTKQMASGQYFVVIQHPMYDKDFNIGKQGTDIVLNETADVLDNANVVTLFNVNDRQTANAAQALCDALDSQNIDDMYVKYAFIVAGQDEAFTINEIPTEVAQGDKLTISGTATAYEGEYVTVEMISTAFAAVPKETVGSASFITLSTKVAEDGTWEVTFDTSDLNVDEYSVKVACGENTWKAVTVNVIEGADEPVTPEQPEQPEQPENPEEPVAPATPGFGALAALAGLGAVAVLLLRRE